MTQALLGSVLFGADEFVAALVASRIPGCERGFAPCSALGIMRRGVVIGGVVYHDFQPHDQGGTIAVSIAVQGNMWARVETLRTLFAYPFVQLDCIRIEALIAKSNIRGRSFIKSLGFREEGKHPFKHQGRETAFSYGLLRRDCRFLRGYRDGQIDATSARAA